MAADWSSPGNALHADLTPDSSGSALFGWMLRGLGQQHRSPVPIGGARAITDALVRRATSRAVLIHTGCPVTDVLVESVGRLASARLTGPS